MRINCIEKFCRSQLICATGFHNRQGSTQHDNAIEHAAALPAPPIKANCLGHNTFLSHNWRPCASSPGITRTTIEMRSMGLIWSVLVAQSPTLEEKGICLSRSMKAPRKKPGAHVQTPSKDFHSFRQCYEFRRRPTINSLKNSLARIGGLEPPVNDQRSSKTACRHGNVCLSLTTLDTKRSQAPHTNKEILSAVHKLGCEPEPIHAGHFS